MDLSSKYSDMKVCDLEVISSIIFASPRPAKKEKKGKRKKKPTTDVKHSGSGTRSGKGSWEI